MTKVVSAAQAVASIKDDAVVTVSSSSSLGCPDFVLKAIGERFESEGHPKNLTTIHPIAAGDMYGVKGVDHIAKDGLLARILGGSYPSGPSSKPMPEIWKMVVENRVAAYNVPSGVLFDMNRETAANRPGVLTKVGLDTFVDPIRQGCAMNDKGAETPIVARVEFEGDTWLHFPNIVPDVAILRATTADEFGNLTYEHEGAYLGGLEQAICVKNHGGLVVAQVSRVTKRGSLRPHDVRVPGHLVDAIVVDPDQKQTCETPYDPAISGQVMRPWDSFSLPEHGVEKIIARRAAMELKPGMTANLGFGISAMVPRILLEEGHPDAVTWAIEQGAVGGVPLTGFAFGCASNADAFVPSPQQFIYFQGGGFDVSFLSFLEVDVDGNVNVSKLGKKPYLTAGCGGFVDIVSGAKKIVFSGWFEAGAQVELNEDGIRIAAPGKFTKLVPEVEHVTFSGKRARELGQEVLYITERCVIRLTENGLEATEIMPGIDPERDIVNASGGRVKIAANAITLPLSLLADAPMGWGQ
ncbi:acyl CoA:acetate/3-ketoacid CoA transferase [Planktomarina temperata]|jgi:acyl CoA:acetate/3-ketoacid CoA transferase|uniref:acyl CoA:acetate/3-ketoacid CoA transferase n=1 Tax=Planktomarina sp. TaxID=2024851 RepID=UPI002304816A|nr:acyl CoA:acetate/3-ketoacid CoA transferase [Planktomarina temperata]MDA7485218.1 acyl CoA:acetate/3-ketoacid CoA transferase [Planktomarina temperata]MDA8767672.1 acyl CoA:acetate/3-ketoacid CoA transferase [Planktomarina temperata]MDA8966182.1 acyl CoA:acetate/3-ketoacid CoA transferase [Planktomarina temperata]MDA9116168.1 acyl CoA:acetate/3-ketoacid CoA transferase [Planktomarina temperata]